MGDGDAIHAALEHLAGRHACDWPITEGAFIELHSLRSTITQKDEEIENANEKREHWWKQACELNAQLRQKDEEIERLRHDREVASRYADWDEYDRMRTALRAIVDRLADAEAEDYHGMFIPFAYNTARNALSTPETGDQE